MRILLSLISFVFGAEWNYADFGVSWANDAVGSCSEQKRGSPIDIKPGKTTYDAELGVLNFKLFRNYMDWDVKNNGHSMVFTPQKNEYAIFGGGLDGTYNLAQFHLHWGSSTTLAPGSEHTVNGQRYWGEVHFVCWKESYGSFSAALAYPDGLAVVGVFLDHNETKTQNANIDRWFQRDLDVEEKDQTGVLESVNGLDFLPKDIVNDMNSDTLQYSEFYRYDGSLTTPDCNEIVIWTVLKTPVQITTDTVNAFTKNSVSMNYRVVQDLAGRTVYSSTFESAGTVTGLTSALLLLVLLL